MPDMKIETLPVTLVDQVEDRLLTFFKEKDLRCGDSIPNENTLSAELGVARSVLREALSRLKMMGLIYTRPRKGMVLTEPSILGGMKRVADPRIMGEDALLDILGFRIALEIGISSDIFRNITERDIDELTEVVRLGVAFGNNEYAPVSEWSFHTKLYQITGNRTIAQFQQIIHPVLLFVKEKFRDYLMPVNVELARNNRLVTHADLLGYLKRRDEQGYREAIERHFEVYRVFMNQRSARQGGRVHDAGETV